MHIRRSEEAVLYAHEALHTCEELHMCTYAYNYA